MPAPTSACIARALLVLALHMSLHSRPASSTEAQGHIKKKTNNKQNQKTLHISFGEYVA